MSFILFIFLLPISALQAAAPAEPILHQKGKTLTINIKKEHSIKALGWQGQSLTKLDNLEQNEVRLQRQGFGALPTKLIVIPKNARKVPLLLDIKVKVKKMELTPKWRNISKNELVIWGETPPAVCTDHTPAKNIKSRIELVLSNPRKVLSFSGAFWVKLSPKSSSSWLHFYNSHAYIPKMQTQALNKADLISKSSCHIYYGGECDRVFNVESSKLGRQYEVKFSDLQKKETSCPI